MGFSAEPSGAPGYGVIGVDNASRRPFACRLAPCALGLLLLAGWIASCAPDPSETTGGNLLAGLRPTRTEGIDRAEVMTDDIVAVSGDEWMTSLSSRFASQTSFVEYDLGQARAISAGLLQGDNNDEYVVTLSEDGASFAPLWRAPPVSNGGQQTRFTTDLHAVGRYVRVAPGNGDGHFGITELQLFAGTPAVFPPQLAARKGVPLGELFRGAVLVLAAAIVAFLLSTARSFHRSFAWAAAGSVLLALYQFVGALRIAWPLSALDVSLVRATAAAVAAATITAAIWFGPDLKPARRAATSVLGVSAAASLLAFFNLGRPQFIDHTTGRPSIVHNFDMRVYFPISKYFEELHFDGVYMASVAAYADDGAGATLTSLADTQLRDLDTLKLERVGDIEPRLRAVQRRFSPARWTAFRHDMRYFRQTMGIEDYLGSLTDHGGNATPVWFSMARLLFSHADASNATLIATALLDPLLLLIMFVAIGRAFGLTTMFVSIVIFGANDFYMFGTNWAGATLRHDWLAFLGLGVCALKVERWKFGGALLALSAMIRAFPALALAGVAMAFVWALWDARKGGPGWFRRALREHQRCHRVLLAAAACIVLLGVVSSLVLSFSAWHDWLRKVAMLDHSGSVNEISLRALIAGTGGDRDAILAAEWPLRALGVAVPVLAVFATTKRRPPHQAALLGVLLVPVIFSPSNYYLHLICLIPLIADEGRAAAKTSKPWLTPRDGASWLSLLGLCAAQYWTVLERDIGLHFRFATVLYFGMLTFFLINALRQNEERAIASPMATSLTERYRPLRRVEYDKLIELGAFQDERIELLEGLLVPMSPIGPPHSSSIQKLTALLVPALAGRAAVRIQCPFAALELSEPEPDVAIVPTGDYDTAHPEAAYLIIEVSESSLSVDRGVKKRLYAACNVPEYWIVNLVERCIEVYAGPTDGVYTQAQTYVRGQSVRLLRFPDLEVQVADVLK